MNLVQSLQIYHLGMFKVRQPQNPLIVSSIFNHTVSTMDPVLEDQIKMGPATLQKSVKPRAEQILELAPPDMVSVVHVS